MDIQKLNGKNCRAAIYLVPIVILLCGCLNFLFYVARVFAPPVAVPYIAFHLLFLLSLGAVFGNITI